jgi:hypothetical protein
VAQKEAGEFYRPVKLGRQQVFLKIFVTAAADNPKISGPKPLAQLREDACFVKTPIDSLVGENVLFPAWSDKAAGSMVRNTSGVFYIKFTEQCNRWEQFFTG